MAQDGVAAGLLAWFPQARRDLPWRTEPRDPYKVLVSEVMLQQTRVETVVPYFARFVQRFPDLHALAAASEEEVLKAWEGLGYYRRARLLHACARVLVADHGGRLPRTVEALRRLPGLGPYTAGALASLAFGARVPAVDGNVVRVAARLEAFPHEARSLSARRAAEAFVHRHQPAKNAGVFNEALMELGALVCTPRDPTCSTCPVSGACAARRAGKVDAFPVTAPRPEATRVRVALAVARRGDLVLLERRKEGLLAGLWGLPLVEGGRAALARHVEALTGGRATVADRPLRRGTHAFTHRTWTMAAYAVVVEDATRGTWRRPDEVPLGKAHRKMLS